jgi:putative tryptophan/tyrosine transport system substrate-binding protein
MTSHFHSLRLYCPRLWRWSIGCFVLIVLALPAAAAEQVCIVLSSEAKPYRDAANEVVATLKSKVTTTICLLDQLGTIPLTEQRCWVAIGTPAAVSLLARRQADQPLVYSLVTDPGSAGLTQSDLTWGVSATVPLARQFQLIADTLPNARTLGLIHHADAVSSEALVAAVTQSLPAGWKVKTVPVSDSGQMAKAIDSVTAGSDVVWTYSDSTLFTDATVRMLLLTALRRKIPVFGFSPAFVRAGALVGVGIDPVSQGHQAGSLVDQILSDAQPEEHHLPPIHLVSLNLIVARKLGITIPDAVTQNVDQIIGGGP